MLREIPGDRRRFSRIAMDCAVSLLCDGTDYRAQLLDVSLKGALIALPKDQQPPIGAVCDLHIHLDHHGGDIRMRGEVCHSNESHLGFLCREIDLESAGHLKRIVELNLGETKLLDRELAELSTA